GRLHAFGAFKREWLGHHGHGQHTQLPGDLGHDRCGARPGTTTHARCDEQHIRALDHLTHALPVFQGGLPAELRIRPGTEATGHVDPQLHQGVGMATLQMLGIGVGADELHTLDAGLDHVVDGIRTATADADDLDHRVFTLVFNYFEKFIHCYHLAFAS